MKDSIQPRDSRGLAVLMGLSSGTKHIYGGTVPHPEVARRRTKNRAARAARRINRRAA